MNKSDRETWMLTHTFACGRLSLSIMFMTWTQLKKMFMKILQSKQSGVSSRVTMPPSLHMVRQAQVKPTPWRALNTRQEIPSVVSFPVQWKRFSVSSKCSLHKTVHLWFVLPICRSIMKLSAISWRSTALAFKSEKIRRRECLLRVYQSGPFALQMRYTVWCRREPLVVLQLRPRWTTCHLGLMQCLSLLLSKWRQCLQMPMNTNNRWISTTT